ncbi:hypothetical protein GCM10011369_21450 [Neiella marina]|uniref:DNA polymerase III subunit psi n=1 Tax=Neiella marina TaxID=508461 RepID=A0A8J2U5M5_9GAMM|nr:DNA polymerase III subunit psi [Neiella marina]GGA79220.1 hypothetical protein GCM10011369_21450 [Neiella marina]
MNQAQWQVLQAMGIDCWQQKAPGEQVGAIGVFAAPTKVPSFAVVTNSRDVGEHRPLLSSIISAVGWQPHDYLLIDDASALTAQQRASVDGVWWLSGPPMEHLFGDQCQHISSVSLPELATNRAEKGALWQQLKGWRQTT